MNSKYWFLTIENNVKLSYSNGSIAFYLGFESSPSQKKFTNVWAGSGGLEEKQAQLR